MLTNPATPFASPYEVGSAEVARKLRALLSRIAALRALVHEREGDDQKSETELDLPALREGLRELEQMACALLYELMSDDEQLLPELPDLPLGEALSQLVENTAERQSLASRIFFSGRERPLADYLARLLYRVAREALERVASHEGAHRLRFSLDYRRAEVWMSIEDDGVPGNEDQLFSDPSEEKLTFPPFLADDEAKEQSKVPDGQILRRLRVMVEGRGGSLVVNSGVEQGVQVQVRLPFHAPERREMPPTPAVTRPASEPSARLKILVVDAQAVSRAGLRRLLESYADLEVVGEAADSVQAISETAELLPQVVLVDTRVSEEQALEILRQVQQLNAEMRVLFLAAQEDEELLYEALRAGVNGYVLTSIAPDELAQAVRSVARGEMLIQPQLAARLLARTREQERARNGTLPQESLTVREQEVLRLLARGLRNKEIAARLFVSERTVNFHLANIYAKLHVSGRTEALSRALELGLLRV